VLLSVPVLSALQEAWPQAQVSYLVPRGTEEMVSRHPWLYSLLVVDRARDTWRQRLALLRELRRCRFDLVLELSGGDRGAILTLLSGARERLGLERYGRPFWQRRGLFTRLLPQPPVEMHMVQQNLEAVRALGLKPGPPRLTFFWDEKVEARTRERLAELQLSSGAFVVMHPGAGWRFKCWTPAGYARIIEALQKEAHLPVVVTASRAAHERELLAAILQECRVTPLNLAGRLTLKELGALLSRARFFFGVDSAPMHLAAAVDTPAVALFGPTGDFNWRPWGEGHLVIKKDWDCLGCGAPGCRDSRISRCLTELSPAEVLQQMRQTGFI
jgi:heptosyltransferase-3